MVRDISVSMSLSVSLSHMYVPSGMAACIQLPSQRVVRAGISYLENLSNYCLQLQSPISAAFQPVSGFISPLHGCAV